MAYIELRNIYKIYGSGAAQINALDNTSFEIEKGELICILGPSGAGKTTCLNILGGMDDATSGELFVDGVDITKLKGKDNIKYRRNDIGFVFQFYNLVQNLTALENVELAVQLCKDHLDPKEIIKRVGLEERLDNFPAQLSGGEQQRVAIARAIAKNPKLLLCDEPTGALDYKNGKQILSLLEETCRESNMTVIIITHNSAIAPMADKVIKFKNGAVEDVIINKNPFVFINHATLESAGEKFESNCIYFNTVDLSEEQKETIKRELLENDEVQKVSFIQTLIESVDNMLKSLDKVVLILIVLAAMLAFVVLYNLSKININERKREIATLKVLGFYHSEVDGYIIKENIILTLVGIVFGLIGGIFLTKLVVDTIEIEAAKFMFGIHPLSFVYAAILTFVFSMIVNLVTHFSLKKINMIESLKSVE